MVDPISAAIGGIYTLLVFLTGWGIGQQRSKAEGRLEAYEQMGHVPSDDTNE